MNRFVKTAVALGASGLLGLAAVPSADAVGRQGAGNGEVSVFHAIPGTTVDVYANGRKLLSDFRPGALTGPMDLRQGDYDVKVLKAGAAADSTPLVERDGIRVAEGSNSTLVANLNPNGSPALNTFSNDVTQVPSNKARLTIRHVAAAGAVDIRANGDTVFKDVKNPDQVRTEVNAGTLTTSVLLAGTDTTVLGPTRLTLAGGSNTVVYAWGSADQRNLALKVQSLTG